MRKIVLLFALLLSAMNMMGQAYEFETEEKILDNGIRTVTCEMKDYTKLSAFSPDIELMMWDYYGDDYIPVIGFRLFKYAIGQYKNSFAVVKKIRELAFGIPKDNQQKDLTINLYMSDGNVLHGTNKGFISVSTIKRNLMSSMDSTGVVEAYIHISLLESSLAPRQIKTNENQQVICQQLRTYDIVKIDVDGVSFDVRGLRSAATFDAMFNALAQKTGKGHLYRYNSSSPSSNVSSGPSASCKLEYIGVLSNGSILCRVDDLQIVGAKGKEASVCAFFEDANDDSNICVFSKKLSTLPYDVCNYESLRVKGNVNDYNMLSQYRSRRFKVTIAVFIGDQSIYDSNVKYITIYNKEGDWYSR